MNTTIIGHAVLELTSGALIARRDMMVTYSSIQPWTEIMNTCEELAIPGFTGDLRDLSPDQLKANDDAARIVGRLTRKGSAETEPVRVAAFNSYI